MANFLRKHGFNKRAYTPVTSGFTLVEMLFYVAITMLLSVAVVTTVLTLDDALLRNQTYRTLTQSATVALDRMGSEIQAASSVNTGLSDFTSSPNTLVLETLGAATTTTFYVSNNTLYVDVNSTSIAPLTAEGVKVLDFKATHYTGLGHEHDTELVRIALTLAVSSNVATTTRTFYTSAIMRDTYE